MYGKAMCWVTITASCMKCIIMKCIQISLYNSEAVMDKKTYGHSFVTLCKLLNKSMV